eukprot:g16524.t1
MFTLRRLKFLEFGSNFNYNFNPLGAFYSAVATKSTSSGEEADEGKGGKKEANGTTSAKQSRKAKADEKSAKGASPKVGSPTAGARTAEANAAALLAATAEVDSD